MAAQWEGSASTGRCLHNLGSHRETDKRHNQDKWVTGTPQGRNATRCRGERGVTSPQELVQRKEETGITPHRPRERGRDIVSVQITSTCLILTTNYFCNGPRPPKGSTKRLHGVKKRKEIMLLKRITPPTQNKTNGKEENLYLR